MSLSLSLWCLLATSHLHRNRVTNTTFISKQHTTRYPKITHRTQPPRRLLLLMTLSEEPSAFVSGTHTSSCVCSLCAQVMYMYGRLLAGAPWCSMICEGTPCAESNRRRTSQLTSQCLSRAAVVLLKGQFHIPRWDNVSCFSVNYSL